MLRTELLIIDADTTTRQFRKEIRWNAAYHRLALGL
jgi:L-arabinose isomerase